MSHSLIIKKSLAQSLSPEAEEFNKLIMKIERLKVKNLKKNGELESCLEYYSTNGFQLIKENVDTRVEFVKLLYEIYQSKNITAKKDKDALSDLIFYQFSRINFYNDIYVPDGFSDFEKAVSASPEFKINEEVIEDLANIYFEKLDEMGIKLDFDIEDWLRNGGSVEDMQKKIQELIFEQAMNNRFQNYSKKQVNEKQKPKSKKQIQLEQVEKNLNDLFRQLARVFHPDLETDESKKEEKQELMKALNTAYKEKNIFTMLQMEIEWLSKSSDRLAKLPEEKLKMFVQSLKEQIKILNTEFREIPNHPRFRVLQKVSFPFPGNSIGTFYSGINSIKSDTVNIELTLDALGDGKNKNTIKTFLKEIHMMNRQMDFEF